MPRRGEPDDMFRREWLDNVCAACANVPRSHVASALLFSWLSAPSVSWDYCVSLSLSRCSARMRAFQKSASLSLCECVLRYRAVVRGFKKLNGNVTRTHLSPEVDQSL